MRPQLGAEARGHLERVRHALPGDVQLWRVDLDAYAEAAPLDGLPADEHARAARFALERDGQRYLAARHALRHLLARALGHLSDNFVIEPDEFGKPHLLPRGSLHFNLSHSAREALIGLSRDRPIGVDIETVCPVVDAGALAAAHFAEAERAEWSRVPESQRDRTFLACWTRKEACLKALGVGVSAQLASIDVGTGPDLRVVAIQLGADRCEMPLQSLDLPGGVVGAVALATPEAEQLARARFRRR